MTGDEIGSVEEEARRLAAAWGQVRGSAPTGGRPDLRVVPDDDSASDDLANCPECGARTAHDGRAVPADDVHACPCCRGTEWARHHAPAALRSVADVAGLVAEGLRALADSLEITGRGGAASDTAADDGGERSARSGHPAEGRQEHV